MHNINFDGKLVKRVKFIEGFKARFNEVLPGSVILFLGSEIEAVSAVSTVLAGIQANSKYHDAKEVVLGILSWSGPEAKHYDSFKFSMEAFQVVGLGYIDEPLAQVVQSEKCLKFRMWFRQMLKRRVLRGETTIIAVPEHKDSGALKRFFGHDVMEQYGHMFITSEVLEAADGTGSKKRKRGKVSDHA